jgi:hypothetical protein
VEVALMIFLLVFFFPIVDNSYGTRRILKCLLDLAFMERGREGSEARETIFISMDTRRCGEQRSRDVDACLFGFGSEGARITDTIGIYSTT